MNMTTNVHAIIANNVSEVNNLKFRLLVDSVKDYAIFFLDENGIIRSWNDGAQRIKGYKSTEIVGQHFSKFYTMPDLLKKHPEYELRTALESSRYEDEGVRVRKDGSEFLANVVITPLYDDSGKHIGFSKVIRDLTERKRSEERLRESERRARMMFEGVKDYAMIMLDANGFVTSWNEGARRIKGYEAFEILGKHFSTFYSEQDLQMGKCDYEMKEALETGRFEDEGWRLRKDGTKFWGSSLITLIRDEKHKVIGFTKVIRDITERKRNEDLLKMAYINLEKRVEERTQALLKTNEQLQQAVQLRDEFLSIASHELRTPMTPLKLQIQSLISHIPKKTLYTLSEDRLQRMAETMDRSISRLSLLVDNLLDVSRLNAKKLTLNYEEFSINELIREVIKRFKSQITVSGSTVQFLEYRQVVASLDRLRIDQVIVNLLTNAIKYGNNNPIEIMLTQNSDFVVITFADKGKGIAADNLSLIFEIYERAHTKSDVGGLGLGLYITKQIVEAHGGTISVSSEMDKGSIFTVKLPLTRKS